VLTGIKENNQVWIMPDGGIVARATAEDTRNQSQRAKLISRVTVTKGQRVRDNGGASMKVFRDAGARPIPGFQLRYIYFLDSSARERLTVPILPFSEIERRGAGMYKGQPRATSIDSDAPGVQPGNGGASPTVALQTDKAIPYD
jgi:hypothetical protein